jgi:hypothetical protein
MLVREMRFIYAFRLIQNTTNDCYTLYNQHRFSLTQSCNIHIKLYMYISNDYRYLLIVAYIICYLYFFHIAYSFHFFFSVSTTFAYSCWANFNKLLTFFCLTGFSWLFLFFNIHFHRFVFTYTFSSFIRAF